MPAKAIPIIVAAVVATSIVIYNNREQIFELVDKTREKLARSIHEFADSIGPRQHETPYGSQSTFEDRLRREEEAEGFLRSGRESVARTSGVHASSSSGLRQRGHAVGDISPAQDQVLFDAMMINSKEIPLQNLRNNTPPPQYTAGNRSPTSGTVQNDQDQMSPLVPRRLTSPLKDQVAPSESGYGSNVVSPAVHPQPSCVARQHQPDQPHQHEEHINTSQNSGFIMPAMAVASTSLLVGGVVVPNSGNSDVLPSVPTSHAPSSYATEDEVAVIPSVIENQDWIQEWANNTETSDHENVDTPGTPSIAGSLPEELEDIPDTLSEFGTASDGGFSEVGSWTEVGSDTSENDH